VCLQDQIKKKLMKSTYANFWAPYEASLDVEVIQEDSKPVKPVTVATITNEMSNLNLDDIKAINAV
jgi:hypothetical protein